MNTKLEELLSPELAQRLYAITSSPSENKERKKLSSADSDLSATDLLKNKIDLSLQTDVEKDFSFVDRSGVLNTSEVFQSVANSYSKSYDNDELNYNSNLLLRSNGMLLNSCSRFTTTPNIAQEKLNVVQFISSHSQTQKFVRTYDEIFIKISGEYLSLSENLTLESSSSPEKWKVLPGQSSTKLKENIVLEQDRRIIGKFEQEFSAECLKVVPKLRKRKDLYLEEVKTTVRSKSLIILQNVASPNLYISLGNKSGIFNERNRRYNFDGEFSKSDCQIEVIMYSDCFQGSICRVKELSFKKEIHLNYTLTMQEQEEILVRDFLFAFQGIETTTFTYDASYNWSIKQEHFDSCLQQSTQTLVKLCTIVSKFRDWKHHRSFLVHGRIVCTAVSVLSKSFDELALLAAQLEMEIEQREFSILEMQCILENTVFFSELLDEIMQLESTSGKFLNGLNSLKARVQFNEVQSEIMEKVLSKCKEEYQSIVLEWICFGPKFLSSENSEFFICVDETQEIGDLVEDFTASYWTNKFTIKSKDQIPFFLSSEQVSKILLAVKYLDVLSLLSIPYETLEDKLVEDDFNAIIEYSFKTASSSLLTVLFEEHDLLHTLNEFKDKFLLFGGDFYSSLFQRQDSRHELLLPYTKLKRIFCEGTRMKYEVVPFTLAEHIAQIHQQEAPASMHMQSFFYVNLDVETSWPLRTLVTKYQLVIDVKHREFTTKLKDELFLSVDEVMKAHENLIDSILRECLLSHPNLLQEIFLVLCECYSFNQSIQTGNVEKVKSSANSFSISFRQLLSNIRKEAVVGNHLYLSNLCTRLDFNGFYSS
eukprot:snap_masked-scaffold_2-processed-gene-25.14-mRNA-1 protein AED:1.00 eAED:1.00 QI:0/0/0/0/1/1/3/0/819